MALLPGIALPPCSLSRCSAKKIRDPLAVGRVRTSRLVYDPSPTSLCGIPWLGYSPPSFPGSHPTATFYPFARSLLIIALMGICRGAGPFCTLPAGLPRRPLVGPLSPVDLFPGVAAVAVCAVAVLWAA